MNRPFTNSYRKGQRRWRPPMTKESLKGAIQAHQKAAHGGKLDPDCNACKDLAKRLETAK